MGNVKTYRVAAAPPQLSMSGGQEFLGQWFAQGDRTKPRSISANGLFRRGHAELRRQPDQLVETERIGLDATMVEEVASVVVTGIAVQTCSASGIAMAIVSMFGRSTSGATT
jgi:hypothetical protein